MQAHELVAEFAGAMDGNDPMTGARGVMDELCTDPDSLVEALSYISGTGGNAAQIFYRSPTLSLLKVNFPVGRRTPPHDHGTWAMILLLSGVEKNTLYRVDDDGDLRRVSEVVLERGSILPMRASAVHVAECIGGAPAIGLHVYGGDILDLKRRMWDPESLVQHPLEWTLYEKLAQKASRSQSAP
jgi:predicted metal-dependent enzyme (double-stranded beta helix superfamily)